MSYNTGSKPKMRLEETYRNDKTGTVIMTPAYGTIVGEISAIGAFVVGSPIPGGRFLVNTAEYIQATSQADRTVMLPDITGKLLFYTDGETDFSDEIPDVLDKDGNFRFIGVSKYGGRTCKEDCSKAPCCPIGYEDEPNMNNFTPMNQVIDVVTHGSINVPTEQDTTPNDDLHVRIKVTKETNPCQLIGGVTPVPDAGTQPLGSNIRIDVGAIAGSAVLIHLGGMSKV